ncbi:PREDICTED: TBC1 domain family member 25 [Nipponia nippon]|uniref:TBC1 domain family member 25 n=1 Tax=Nipponia nippon TaxID=128390 RepID=UPI0005117092|nr:PREDICTED: TBC1 domain family member 25 [Nipponia nippon]
MLQGKLQSQEDDFRLQNSTLLRELAKIEALEEENRQLRNGGPPAPPRDPLASVEPPHDGATGDSGTPTDVPPEPPKEVQLAEEGAGGDTPAREPPAPTAQAEVAQLQAEVAKEHAAAARARAEEQAAARARAEEHQAELEGRVGELQAALGDAERQRELQEAEGRALRQGRVGELQAALGDAERQRELQEAEGRALRQELKDVRDGQRILEKKGSAAKSEGLLPPEFRSFAVDPQITSLDVLQHILARAFDLQGKKSFSVSFVARDPQGQETFVPLLSDGDLAAAFACARPVLRLRLDVRPPAESPLLEDWDIISPREVAAAEPLPERRSLLAAALPFTQALLAQVGRTLARAQAALLALVGAAVRKDVVRTDRGHPYFGGPEEGHPHLAALQALLTTFALGHPRLSYCQGMSDVAAPLLAVLDDEAQAFLCFCALMRRLGPRFRPGGRGLARAFAHLRRLLRRADPPFWAFLAARGAHDLLFCYRWLLLELKREFAFEDALRVLEITWSSLPPAPPPPPDEVDSGRGGHEACGDGQEGPRRSSDIQDGSKASVDGPEAPASSIDDQEKPKSSSNVQEGAENSRNIQKDPKSFGDDQEGLESSSNVQGGSKKSGGNHEKPEVFGDVQPSPDGSWNDQEDLKISRDVRGSAKVPGDGQGGLKASGEVQGGAKVPRGIQEDPKVSSDGGQDPDGPKDTRDDPDVSKKVDQDLGVPKKINESANAFREIGEQPNIYKAVCGDRDVSKKACEGRNISKKVREDLNTLEKVSDDHGVSKRTGGDPDMPKEIGKDPKEIGKDPKEISKDPEVHKEVGDTLKEIDNAPNSPQEVGEDPGEYGPVQHLAQDLFTRVALHSPSMDQYGPGGKWRFPDAWVPSLGRGGEGQY